jgi:hypothetical protein
MHDTVDGPGYGQSIHDHILCWVSFPPYFCFPFTLKVTFKALKRYTLLIAGERLSQYDGGLSRGCHWEDLRQHLGLYKSGRAKLHIDVRCGGELGICAHGVR